MMKALLPPSRLWRLDENGFLGKLLLATADELARIDQRARDLLRESDPRTATELLPDFERVLEIPPEGTLDERRARVAARLVRRQRFRPRDFQTSLAPLLGQAPDDVVVIERGRAFAVLVQDDREIFRFFIHRDPTLPGTYDLVGTQDMIERMAPSHTKGHVIESVAARCDDPFSLCNRDLLGV